LITICITSNKEINGNCVDQESKTVFAYSRESDIVEKSVDDVFSNLPNSASFHITFEDNSACVPRWLGKKHL